MAETKINAAILTTHLITFKPNRSANKKNAIHINTSNTSTILASLMILSANMYSYDVALRIT